MISNVFKTISVSIAIWKITKEDIVELIFEMNGASGFIVLVQVGDFGPLRGCSVVGVKNGVE